MIKKSVTYQDFNDRTVTEDLYFHAPMNVLLDHIDLEEEFEALAFKLQSNPDDEMSMDDKKKILGLIKRLIAISYGQRSADGSKFYQGPEVLREFQSSAAYDAFLWAMFTDSTGGGALEFMKGIFPKDLAEKAAQIEAQNGPKRPQDRLPKQQSAAEPRVSGNQEVEFAGTVEEPEEDVDIAELEARLAAAKQRAETAVRGGN